MIGGICTPALIYLIFSISQILIDTVKGFFNTALVKMILTVVFTFILNYLCQAGLGILSWIIVFIPFILMTVIVTLLLFTFNLDPKTGRMVRAEEADEGIRKDLIIFSLALNFSVTVSCDLINLKQSFLTLSKQSLTSCMKIIFFDLEDDFYHH